jgi:glucokinase
MTVAIGVDVGGTKIAAAVVEGAHVIARRQLQTEAASPTAIVAAVTKVVQELRAAAPAAAAVGIGAAGLIDLDGRVVAAPHLAWEDLPLRAMVADRVGLPVVADNDANVAAWGEYRYGAGKGRGDQVLLTLGTGIGGGLVLNGHLHRGANGFGAEIGHMVLDPDGPPCACGGRGCFEILASGAAIGRETTDAALAGDATALARIAEAGRWLGIGCASLIHLLDPDLIVIGGGAGSRLGELLLAPARTSLEGRIMFPKVRPIPPLVVAELGADAGVVGAAALAVDALGATRS